MESVDSIVIGAGHNGLICAAYLARAGLKVAVIERNPEIGGGCTTEELTLPGFRHNPHANFHFGCGDSPWFRDLELQRFGFSYILPRIPLAMMFQDETCLIFHQDPEKTAASFARTSKQDAETFLDFHDRYAVRMRPLILSFHFSPPLSADEARARIRGPEGEEFLAFNKLSVIEAIESTFEHEKIRNFFKLIVDARMLDPLPGTGLFFPAIFSGLHQTALATGGSQELPRALARSIEADGGVIVRGKTVREIVLKSGEAREVVLDDGERWEARKCIASAINAPQTMEMIGEEAFEDEVVEKLRGWKWGGRSLCTLHLALNEPPRYPSAAYDPDMDRVFNTFLGPMTTAEYVETMAEVESGMFPSHPMGNGACNTLQDPTYAPEGKHVAFWWPYAPFELKEGGSAAWDEIREEATQRLLEAWRGYSTNLTEENVLATHVFTPLDISRGNINMVQGSVHVGAYCPGQIGIDRPHPTMSGFRTPIRGLYFCSSTTGPGSGLNGAAGYGAVNVIAEDLKLKPWWEKVPSPEWPMEKEAVGLKATG